MSAFIIVPILFIVLGAACLIFPRQIGISFCRFGRTLWRIGTFGLTDMRWFYREEKAPFQFRLQGAFFLLFGIVMMTLLYFPFTGPGSLSAMREASTYLKETYGNSGLKWNISVKKEDENGSRVTITYRYGEKSGTLKGRWEGDKYLFYE